MMCTIMIGRYSSVQGLFVKRLADGRITVRVGTDLYTGRPVSAPVAEVVGAA